MPHRDQRMTEMESGHFAGAKEVIDANGQALAEAALQDEFRHYVDLAKTSLLRLKRTVEADIRLMNVGPQELNWLDVGCGTGGLLMAAGATGFAVQGIELTADRRASASQITDARIHSKPLEDLDLPEQSFDVVSMVNVFSHLTDPTATIREIRRVLKPQGILLIATGEIGDGVRKTHIFRWNLGDHLYFLGSRTMSRFCIELGFSTAAYERKWLPAQTLSEEFLFLPGRSRARNLAKRAIAFTPLVKRLLLWTQRRNPVYSSVFILGKCHGAVEVVG